MGLSPLQLSPGQDQANGSFLAQALLGSRGDWRAPARLLGLALAKGANTPFPPWL